MKRYMSSRSLEAIMGLVGDEDDSEYYVARDEEFTDAKHAQAAHSTTVGNTIYAVSNQSAERFNLFFEASLQWHLLFDLEPSAHGVKRPRSEDDSEAAYNPALEEQVRRVNELGTLTTDSSFQKMMKTPHAQLHKHQADLFAAMKSYEKIVWVVETGGGKSISFALPAYAQPDSCTVVVQPTKALQKHTKQSLERLGISVAIYDSRPQETASSVVLVTPEALSYMEWQAFAHRKRLRHEIDRVILDEAHDVLLSSEEWRPKVKMIRESLDQISHRQLFITGTLPPSQQSLFMKRLGLDHPNSAEQLIVLRNKTTRDNIRYEYMDVEIHTDLPQVLRDLITTVTEQKRRAILFSMSTAECDTRALTLGIPSYHRKMSPQEQAKALDMWNQNRGAISASTSLAYGIDYPDVSLVICVGAYDMMTLCQQFGRAGRDGKPAAAILAAPRHSLGEKLRDFATASCPRYAVGQYLDGKPQQCGPFHNACTPCALRFSRAMNPHLPTPASSESVSRPSREEHSTFLTPARSGTQHTFDLPSSYRSQSTSSHSTINPSSADVFSPPSALGSFNALSVNTPTRSSPRNRATPKTTAVPREVAANTIRKDGDARQA
ncbi:ATP-dependent DNA helicase Q-like 3 [Daldinia childiae]|uniref:ATP-dependent DNA helicase Q-like 3 n=1 Tax=Daldinia childiae TaxID=326645 RepID=UPI00144781E7|nr:ATP-dependent DNA helicase Q-like 3 [Daldinia childiae]KAF3068380.1 ATP-dependent DNA helicase Q-like 3 [Daldinia childiae]